MVYSVVLDPIRNQACSGSMDGSVRVWNLHTGQLIHVLAGHTSLVGLLGMSPSHLVSAAADSTLRIWHPDTGELQHTLMAHTGAITCFQHDEFKVLSGSDGNLKMWDIREGTVVRDLLTGITGVWQVVFEGRWCVAASNRSDATVLDVWDFAKEEDEEWVGEPPGGMYDEDGFSEAEDEDEDEMGTKRIRKMAMDMRMASVDGDGEGEGEGDGDAEDADAMDQDLFVDSDSQDSGGGDNIEVDDEGPPGIVSGPGPGPSSSSRGPGEAGEAAGMPPLSLEGVGASRWAPQSRAQGSGSADRLPRVGGASTSKRTTTASTPQMQMQDPPPFGQRTLPSTDETPTRPRLRGTRRR
ncbi:hypothetical protein C0993_006634 [Termitomyces sp. T159_Od127]|nr:hypothetical protein C0993_006634 [Termitomyces sp. T159_Od127]